MVLSVFKLIINTITIVPYATKLLKYSPIAILLNTVFPNKGVIIII